jgi:hypothetical protein
MGDRLDDAIARVEGIPAPPHELDAVLAGLPQELAGSRAKVERARKHFEELDEAIRSADGTDFYRLVREDDPGAGTSVWRFRMVRDLPDEWSVIAGEFGRLLRSALNLAVYQLALHDTGKPGRGLAFPIITEAKDYASKRPHYLGGIHEAHWALFDALQPHLRGNQPFADLAWLTNEDHHKILHGRFVQAGEVEFEFDMDYAGPPIEEATVDAPGQPLHDGTQIAYARAKGGLPGMDVKARFKLDVAFGERGLRWGHLEVIGGRTVAALDDIGRLLEP